MCGRGLPSLGRRRYAARPSRAIPGPWHHAPFVRVPLEGGFMSRLEFDAYRVFLTIVFTGMGLVSASMLAIAVWLFRRNRRLPRLVKPKR